MSLPQARPGRWIRTALVMFPVGLVITSLISFGIWWRKKHQVEARTAAFARAMRADWDEARLKASAQRLAQGWAESSAAFTEVAASFMESSMAAESMGYLPRRVRLASSSGELSVVDAELTGARRPRRIQMVLLPLREANAQSAQDLATLFALAHSLSGEVLPETLRFVLLPLQAQGRDVSPAAEVARAMASRDEQLVELIILGGRLDQGLLAGLERDLGTRAASSLVRRLPSAGSAAEALLQARALRVSLLKAQGL